MTHKPEQRQEQNVLSDTCDVFHHAWREEYYGYVCEVCGQFIPFGCEPWLPDDEGALSATEQSK